MTHKIMCTSYLCEVAQDVFYQRSIERNLFVSSNINKGKNAYIRPFQNQP